MTIALPIGIHIQSFICVEFILFVVLPDTLYISFYLSTVPLLLIKHAHAKRQSELLCHDQLHDQELLGPQGANFQTHVKYWFIKTTKELAK